MADRVTLYATGSDTYIVTMNVKKECFLERVFAKSDVDINNIEISRIVNSDTEATENLRTMEIPSNYSGGSNKFLFVSSNAEVNAWRFFANDVLKVTITLSSAGSLFIEIDGVIYSSAEIT